MTAADLKYAAQACRTLASAEQARLAEDYQEMSRLMDPHDPIELMAVAAMLEVEALCREQGIALVPPAPHVRVDADGAGRRVTDRVVHIDDDWSRRIRSA